MTPGALRDWIPVALHGELDRVSGIATRLLAASPSPFVGVWPSHLLAAIEELAVAPWLGVSLFLGSDPLAQTGRLDRLRLWDEERDWNRHAVLLGDLARRFGEALVEPLSAIPGPLRPRIVRDWLTGTPVDRRIVEAEDEVYRGDHAAALGSLLRLWREGGDPLVADVIDVVDARVGDPMDAARAAALWLRGAAPPADVDVGRSLRSGILATADPAGLFGALGASPPDPRIATAIRATLLTRESRGADVSLAAGILARTGDVRGLARVAWEHRLPAADAAGMWTVSAGPAARARLRALARRVGGNVDVPDATLRALHLAAWGATGAERPLAVAVLTDAMRERGDPRVPALGRLPADGVRALPPPAIERLCDRPYGLRSATASFEQGLVPGGEPTDIEVAVLDPAWGPLQQLTVQGLRSEGVDAFPNLRVVMTRGAGDSSVEGCAAFLDRVNVRRAAPLELVGDQDGDFAQVPGDHTAIVLGRTSRLPAIVLRAQVRHVAGVAALKDVPSLLMPVVRHPVERVTVCERGVPLVAPVGWSVEFAAHRFIQARWYGPGLPNGALADMLRQHPVYGYTLPVWVPATSRLKELRRKLRSLGCRLLPIPPEQP